MRRIMFVAVLVVSSFAFAGAKTYQVTGPILEIRDDVVVVQKGKDKWEVNKGSMKVEGELKVGAKVTIEYTMTAEKASVTAAPAPAKK